MANKLKLNEEALHCYICTQRYTVPKILPCQHTFCQRCLENHMKTKFGKSSTTWTANAASHGKLKFSCPLCKRSVDVPENGLAGFADNILVNTLADVMDNSSDLRPANCSICEQENETALATGYCPLCQQNLCDECQVTHKKFGTTKDHTVLILDKTASVENTVRSIHSQKQICCTKHKNEPLKFYCTDCREVLCRDCLLGKIQTDKKHDIIELDSMAQDNRREDIRRILDEFRSRMVVVDRVLDEIVTNKQDVAKKRAEVEAGIKEMCETLISRLNGMAGQEVRNLDEQATIAKKIIASVKAIILYGEVLLSFGQNVELLQFGQQTKGELPSVPLATESALNYEAAKTSSSKDHLSYHVKIQTTRKQKPTNLPKNSTK